MKKSILKTAALFTAVLLTLTACNGSAVTQQDVSDNTSVEEETISAETQQQNSTKISLSDTAVTADGSGAEIDGSTVTITGGGIYTLSGSLSSGQVIVNAPKTTDVTLVLDGVDITGSVNAAIYCKQANNLYIVLAENSENILSDASSFTYSDTEKEEPDATLFSKTDLTISGTGTLTVNSDSQNGILSKDDLVIEAGTYSITAANHGIRGRDSVTILDGEFNITAKNDGIQSNNDEDVSKGWINISGGEFVIDAGHDGIQSETVMDISGGTFDITTGTGASGKIATDALLDSDSYKAVKAGGSLNLSGGDFTIDSTDDAIHSNADISAENVTMNILTGDDGIHADGSLVIESGTINVNQSYEGIEASVMYLNGGDIRVVSSDDGINVAGGTDENEDTGQAGNFGKDSFSSTSNRWLYISGGNITVVASGDGIDVNGNTEITGGNIYVSGPEGRGDGSLDYDGTFTINGGILVAAGSSGMAQSVSTSSEQGSIMVYFTSAIPAGSSAQLKSSGGEVIAEYAPEKSFETIVLSVPEIKEGGTYTLAINGTDTLEITTSSLHTKISDSGETVSTGMGQGGMPPGGDMSPEGGGRGARN